MSLEAVKKDLEFLSRPGLKLDDWQHGYRHGLSIHALPALEKLAEIRELLDDMEMECDAEIHTYNGEPLLLVNEDGTPVERGGGYFAYPDGTRFTEENMPADWPSGHRAEPCGKCWSCRLAALGCGTLTILDGRGRRTVVLASTAAVTRATATTAQTRRASWRSATASFRTSRLSTGASRTVRKTFSLDFAALREQNISRLARWHDPESEPWTGADWSNAMCGEAGETANVVKKLRRHETRTSPQGDPSEAELRVKLSDEIADVIIYADLLAHFYGIDSAIAVAAKFNRKSIEQGFPERLGVREPDHAGEATHG